MEDSLKNLSVLFRDTLFRIPDYQRGYAWTKKNYEDFWNDLINLDTTHNYDHYAGVLTTQLISENELAKDKWDNDRWLISKKKYTAIHVVDGQQRLTTAVLLIAAIVRTMRCNFPEVKELNYTSLEKIEERFLFEKKGETDTYSCIFGYEPTDSSFLYYCQEILQMPNFGNEYKKTKYSENMNEAFSYFLTKLESKSLLELEQIYSKLTNNLVFNMYQISDKLDVFVTFETMNNRGKMLSNLELLKNRFIYLTTIANPDEDDPDRNKNTRDIINESWKIIYSYLGKNDSEMLDDEEFLEAHIGIYRSKNNKFINEQIKKMRRRWFASDKYPLLDLVFTRNNLNDNKISIDDIIHFAQRISQNSKIWYELNNPEDSKFSTELCELLYKNKLLQKAYRFGYRYPRNNLITLFEFFQQEADEKIRALFIRYMIKYQLYISIFDNLEIVMKETITINETLMGNKITKEALQKALSAQKKIFRKSSIQDLLLQEISKQIKNGSTSNTENRISFYNNYRFPTEYVLKTYELSLIDNNVDEKHNTLKKKEILFGNYTVEHIYPQRESDDWKQNFSEQFSTPQRYILKNSLGNLIYVTNGKNQQFGNKTFKIKVGELGTQVGFINGNYSEKEIAQHNQWTDKEILDRSIKLITFYLDLLELPRCNKSKKKILLGLDFMK